MTFYLIGLGLDVKSISVEAPETLKNCEKVYLDNYSIEFPYDIEYLEETFEVRIIPMTRILIESEDFVMEAKDSNIALLVYGSPLIATTHISLILKCRKEGINYRILHNASIIDAISETGLQFYKFGKTASMPKWTENYKPDSFANIIKENAKIKAHTLVLADIGLSYGDALRQLREACKNKKFKLNKIIACSRLGTDEGRIFYDSIDEIAGNEIYSPFCFIIPGKLHFLEEEALESAS